MTGASPVRFVHDHDSGPTTVVELEFLARQSAGLRFGSTIDVSPQVVPRDLIPPDGRIEAVWETPIGVVILAEGDGYSLQMDARSWGTVVRIAAADVARVRVLADFVRQFQREEDTPGVKVSIWNYGPGGPDRSLRQLAVPCWADVEANYPAGSREALSGLMVRRAVTEEEGRLILLHGEPGTGKTTAIRALIQAWSSWSDAHLVVDPDQLFARSSYLIELLRKPARDSGEAPTLDRAAGPLPKRWRMVIAEDADAYLHSTARRDAGAALGQLLNATDGLLAQSARTVIILTTNEPLGRIHPAVVRPGRCLAEIEVGRFDQEQARAWLGDTGTVSACGATLAELYHIRRGDSLRRPVLNTGTYL